MRSRSGHSSAVSTAPTTTSLTRPLAKLASACFENSRLKPASGEIFDSFGVSASNDQTSRCWIRLPASAASISSRNGTATAAEQSRGRSSANSARQRRAVDADVCANWRSGRAASRSGSSPIAAGERDQHQRRAGDHEPGIDLLALDHVAALERLVQPLLCRVFCLSRYRLVRRPCAASGVRRELREHAFDVADEGRPSSRRSPATAAGQPEHDRQRQADEEHLHLRHQPRQHAEPEIEQQAEHQKRRRRAGCRCGRRWRRSA